MNTGVKKIIKLLLIGLILIPFNVNAAGYKIVLSYFTNGGSVSSGNVEDISGVLFLKDSTTSDITYTNGQTISHINSLDGTNLFTLKKNGVSQTPGKEWYTTNYSNGKKAYFSNSESYTVSKIIKKIGMDENYAIKMGEISIFIQANYEKPVKVKSVSLNTSTLTIKEGKTTQLSTKIYPSNATNKEVTWTSEDPTIVTVTANGTVKGVKAGKAKVVATTKDGGKVAKCLVKVKGGSTTPVQQTIKVTDIKLNKSSTKIEVGKTETVKATITPTNATNKEVTWKSSNKKIATVDEKGKVKAVKEGTATITVTTKDNNKTDSVKITVVKSKKETHKVIIKYNVNTGKLASKHDKSITVKDNVIKENGNDKFHTISYNESTTANGLANYANEEYINLEKDGFIAKIGEEWNTKPNGKGKSYSQSEEYKASDFCDASEKDCTVTLYVNWEERNRVYFLETGTDGSTDSILLMSGRKYGLIDTSEDGSYNYVSQQLEKLGVKELEFLQYTHMHADHTGDHGDYLASKDFKIKKLYIKVDGSKTKNYYQGKYQAIIDKAKNNNIEICNVKSSKCNDFYLGTMHLKLYNTEFHKPAHIKAPSSKKESDRTNEDSNENLNSIVTLATVHNKKIYLAGDIGDYDLIKESKYVTSSDKQETKIAKEVGKVDVYKVAHHGNGKYNGYPDLQHGKSPSISILKPKYSIFTAYKNKKDPPNSDKEARRRLKRKEIENELKNLNSKLYYTGEGTVVVDIDEKGNLSVSQKKKL